MCPRLRTLRQRRLFFILTTLGWVVVAAIALTFIHLQRSGLAGMDRRTCPSRVGLRLLVRVHIGV
jgi:hypothetical protein